MMSLAMVSAIVLLMSAAFNRRCLPVDAGERCFLRWRRATRRYIALQTRSVLSLHVPVQPRSCPLILLCSCSVEVRCWFDECSVGADDDLHLHISIHSASGNNIDFQRLELSSSVGSLPLPLLLLGPSGSSSRDNGQQHHQLLLAPDECVLRSQQAKAFRYTFKAGTLPHHQLPLHLKVRRTYASHACFNLRRRVVVD